MKLLQMAVLSISLLGLTSCAHYGSHAHKGKACEGKSCELKKKKGCCKDKAQKDSKCKKGACKTKDHKHT